MRTRARARVPNRPGTTAAQAPEARRRPGAHQRGAADPHRATTSSTETGTSRLGSSPSCSPTSSELASGRYARNPGPRHADQAGRGRPPRRRLGRRRPGEDSLEAGCRVVIARGVGMVAATCGAEGAVVVDPRASRPALPPSTSTSWTPRAGRRLLGRVSDRPGAGPVPAGGRGAGLRFRRAGGGRAGVQSRRLRP